MWFTPMFSTFYLTNNSFKFSIIFSKIIDQGWGEHWGPKGISYFIINISKFNQVVQMNKFKFYLLSLLIWMTFMILI